MLFSLWGIIFAYTSKKIAGTESVKRTNNWLHLDYYKRLISTKAKNLSYLLNRLTDKLLYLSQLIENPEMSAAEHLQIVDTVKCLISSFFFLFCECHEEYSVFKK